MRVDLKPRAGACRWMTFWTVLSFASLLYAQPSENATPPQTEVAALAECQRTVFGGMDADKKIESIYDTLYGQWLIKGERADEIIGCLVERYQWIGLKAPDGRRGARASRALAVAQHAEDRLIVPGERIAGVKLDARLADIEAVHGKGQPMGTNGTRTVGGINSVQLDHTRASRSGGWD